MDVTDLIEEILQKWGLSKDPRFNGFSETFRNVKLPFPEYGERQPKRFEKAIDRQNIPLEVRLISDKGNVRTAINKLREELNTNKILETLSYLYVDSLYEMLKGNEGQVTIALGQIVNKRLYNKNIVDKVLQDVPSSSWYLRSCLESLLGKQSAFTLVPDADDAFLPTYKSFRRSIAEAFVKVFTKKETAELLGINLKSLNYIFIEYPRAIAYAPPPKLLKLDEFRLVYVAYSNTDYMQRERGGPAIVDVARRMSLGVGGLLDKLKEGIKFMVEQNIDFPKYVERYAEDPEPLISKKYSCLEASGNYVRGIVNFVNNDRAMAARILGKHAKTIEYCLK